MKKILYILSLFLTFTGFSQNVKISYEYTIVNGLKPVRDDYLFINIAENKASYIQDMDSKRFLEDIDDIDNLITIDRRHNFNYLFLDPNKREMNIYEDFARNFYKIIDVFPEFQWQLINENKMINNLKVQKAIGKYRGNTWEVWFAESIPYGFGPRKLNGLPGVILEAKDQSGKIHIKAIKIEFDKECFICNIPNDRKIVEVSYKDYLIMKDDLYNNFERDIERDVIVSYEKKSFLLEELEFEFPIDFSWEEKERK